AIAKLGFRGIVSWSVWSGVSLMTCAALLNFFWDWRTIKRAFSGVAGAFGKRKTDDPMERIEVPGSWFLWGVAAATLGCIVIEWRSFGIPLLLGLLAVLVSAVMAIVACRATGETDVTPI